MQLRRIGYVVMIVVAAACLAFAIYYRHVAAVALYDSNFEAFHEILSAARQTTRRTERAGAN